MIRTRSRPRLSAGLAIAAVVTALTAALAAAPASAQTPPGIVPEGDWHQLQIDWMVNWIAENEAVVPGDYPVTYDDGGAALEDLGFFNFGATAPGGYDHWIAPTRLGDTHILNTQHPESLVYQHVGDGVWELKAAMYMLAQERETLPELISWIPGWHGHPELCVGPDGRFAGLTDPEDPDCPPGTTQATTPIMVHAWLEDPGCGHRFGGVGVGGLHCDHMHGGH